MSNLLFLLWLIKISCEKIKAMDTLKYRNIEKKPAISNCKLWTQWHHMGWTKIIDERANSFLLHCVLLGCFASFLSTSHNDHSYTTNATMRQDGFKKFVRYGDRVAFVNKTRYMRLDLCCFSVAGRLPSPLWVAEVYLPDSLVILSDTVYFPGQSHIRISC